MIGEGKASAITSEIAARFDVTPKVLRETIKNRYLNQGRAELAARLKSDLRWSLPRIAAYLGGVSTRTICNLLNAHDGVHEDVDSLRRELGRARRKIADLQRQLQQQERRAA